MCALRNQVRIEEGEVTDLIIGVVVNIYEHVLIEIVQRFGIGRISASAWNLFILDTPKLVVLLPEIRLQNLKCSEEPQNVDIALGDCGASGSSCEGKRCRRNKRAARKCTGAQKAAPVGLNVPCHVSLL